MFIYIRVTRKRPLILHNAFSIRDDTLYPVNLAFTAKTKKTLPFLNDDSSLQFRSMHVLVEKGVHLDFPLHIYVMLFELSHSLFSPVIWSAIEENLEITIFISLRFSFAPYLLLNSLFRYWNRFSILIVNYWNLIAIYLWKFP